MYNVEGTWKSSLIALTVGLLTPETKLASRRSAVLSGTAYVFGSRACAAEPSYRVAMSVLVNPSQKTTGETVIIEVMPEWAPLGADRFRELVELGFYCRSRFHRVLPGYVAQFGISTSRERNSAWLCKTCKRLPDEPRIRSNQRGTLSFAQASQKDTRQTQVFVNLADNGGLPNFLDAQGFTPFARIVSGMETIERLYAGYGLVEAASGGMAGAVSVPKAAYYCEEYLDEVWPKLSLIQDVRLL